MRQYYRDIVRKRLREVFDDQDAETVLTWLISNDGRLPVVVVGAGFSRNAVNKRTDAPATWAEVPLWGDVLQCFATELRVEQKAYDALTLAELYYEEMGPARFNSTLLSMLKDDELLPGIAHSALFAYPKQAVVTTNQLDTLLDKNGRNWLPVVNDPDLALCKADNSVIELIYFHGHRNDRTSWVFTRSQYEDLSKRKPLMVTRVRQLLSQHPVLIVGYSLSDPDFHHIYRQLSLDMTYHHPLGLALFPNKMGPSAPERRHWEKLGIRIATFKAGPPSIESFKRFFDISPAPAVPLDNAQGIKSWIRDGSDFKERCHRAQDFLSHPERSKIVRIGRDSEYDIWLEPIKSTFTEADWKRVNFIHSDDDQYDEATTATSRPAGLPSDSRSSFRGYSALDRKRFRATDSLPRQIDAFLSRRMDLKLDLARWLTFAFDEDLARNKTSLLDLVSWVWRITVGDPSGHQGAHREASDAMRRCLADALKNDYQHQQEHIREDAHAIGLDLSGVIHAGDRPSEFLQKMKEGLNRILDGSFLDARRAYEEAGAIAKRRGNSFDQWVAFHGEEDAMLASTSFKDRSTEESQSCIHDYHERRLTMEQSPKVAQWMEQARELREKLDRMVIQRFIRQNRGRRVSEQSMSWSASPYSYWRMFRDLETIDAPPALQRTYVRPLIDLGELDPEEELRYRLRLGVDETEKTEQWLSRIIDNPHMSLKEQQQRDNALLHEFMRADITKFERVQRLASFPKIASIFRREDLDHTPSFLMDCKKELGQDVRTFTSIQALSDDYARAWGAYADLEVQAQVLDHLEAYASTIQGRIEPEKFSNELRGMPLEHWVGLHEDAAERLVRLVLNLARGSHEQDVSSSDEDLAWALFSVVHGANRFGRPLTDAAKEEVRAWAGLVLHKKVPSERSYLKGAFIAVAHLAYFLAPDDDTRANVVKEALTGAGERPMGVWISLVEAGEKSTSAAMTEAADKLWSKLGETWEETLRIARSNPHDAWRPVAFLVETVRSEIAKPVTLARERLLHLVEAAPIHLSLCAEILGSSFWGDKWQSFIDLIWKMSGGGEGQDVVAARMGAVDLFRRWVDRTPPGSGELPTELRFLVDLALLAMVDESPWIANHAAYGIVGYAAHVRAPNEVTKIAGALRRMALDPRLGVRHAAAYAGTKLPLMDVADEIRAVAQELDKAMAEDPYAAIQRQRAFGELDAKYPRT